VAIAPSIRGMSAERPADDQAKSSTGNAPDMVLVLSATAVDRSLDLAGLVDVVDDALIKQAATAVEPPHRPPPQRIHRLRLSSLTASPSDRCPTTREPD